MKVTCPRDELLTACQLVSAAVAARTTKPVLSQIKAIAEGDGLTLMAFDTEVGIRYETRGVAVARPGAAILPVAQLTQLLRESRDDEVSLDAGENATAVRVGTGKYDLPAWPVDEFPDFPGFDDGGRYHEITAGVLRTMIRRVTFAADKKDGTARYALTGVLWEADGDVARLVATDSKRLAVCEGPAVIAGPPEATKASHLVPARAVALLDRSLADDGEPVRVALRANDARFRAGRATVYTALVQGRFPAYREYVGDARKKATVRVELPANEFLSRIRQAAVTADDDGRRVDLAFAPGELTLTARGAETGASEVVMALPDFPGPESAIAFDPQYVIDFLRAIDGEPTVLLEMSGAKNPAVFRVGDGYQYMVMPLQG